MSGIDPMSLMLGKIEGTLDAILREQKKAHEEIHNIRDEVETTKKILNNYRVKQAGVSAAVATIISIVVAFFNGVFKP